VFRLPLKMHLFRADRIRSVSYSSWFNHISRYCAWLSLAFPKKPLFFAAPLSLLGAISLALLVIPTAMIQAEEISNPMQPPAYALKKFQQAKFKNRVSTVNTGKKINKPAVKPLKLTSILFSSERKIAIIDDHMLRVGDTIGSAKLVRINRNSARLLKKGKIIELKLDSETNTIKKTPSERKL